MVGYGNVQALDLAEVRKEVSFPVLRENLISEESEVGAGKDSVLRGDTMEALGIISKRRGLLNYGDIMDWMVSQFDASGVNFKLKDSTITKKGGLFQEYLFDIDVDNPDAEAISPMVIAKASYVGKPLEIMFGTYRFVCSNGAIVGTTMDSIEVKSREINDLLSHSIENDIAYSMDNMNRVSQKYRDLSNQPFQDYLNGMISSDKVPTGLKKSTMYKLRDDGTIQLLLEEDGITLKGEHFKTKYPDTLYSINSDKTAWALYNDMTEISTHRSRSVSSRSSTALAVAEVFGI